MSERKPAPGRGVRISYRAAVAVCDLPPCTPPERADDPAVVGVWSARAGLANAADALREHLRTEHADLWESCIRCLGSGCGAIWPHCGCCPACNGRGYVERSAQDSHAARQEASSTTDGSKGAGSGNEAQIAGNACGDRLGTWHGPIGPCVRTGRHDLHDDGAGITWSRTNVPDLTGEPS